jgi:hypothetical protein
LGIYLVDNIFVPVFSSRLQTMDSRPATARPSGPQNWSNEDWERHRPAITQLYTTMKLKEVIEVMEKDGFKAT